MDRVERTARLLFEMLRESFAGFQPNLQGPDDLRLVAHRNPICRLRVQTHQQAMKVFPARSFPGRFSV